MKRLSWLLAAAVGVSCGRKDDDPFGIRSSDSITEFASESINYVDVVNRFYPPSSAQSGVRKSEELLLRVVWASAFEHPVCVSIWQESAGTLIAETVTMSGKGAYRWGHPASRTQRPVEKPLVERALSDAASEQFWTPFNELENALAASGTDGTMLWFSRGTQVMSIRNLELLLTLRPAKGGIRSFTPYVSAVSTIAEMSDNPQFTHYIDTLISSSTR